MKSNFIIGLFLIFIALVYGCSADSSNGVVSKGSLQKDSDSVGINQGQLAPDFSVKTVDGNEVSLRSLTDDKPTVVYFFATWCPNCANDLAAVKKVFPKYKDKINFLAIDMDSRESESVIRNYQKSKGIDGAYFAAGNNIINSLVGGGVGDGDPAINAIIEPYGSDSEE